MSLEECCCLAFNAVPSQLHREIFWNVTLSDIKTKVKLYIGEQQAKIIQDFQSMMEVMSLAFGDGSKKQDREVEKPKSAADARAKFAQLKL